MTPNSIGLLVGFTAICTWLGIQPSLNVLGHFVGVTVTKTPHYHLQATQASGDFKIVLDAPTSYKGWKERFVWASGCDPKLSCLTWPEIRKGALGSRSLSAAEKQDVELIRSYSGPRKMEDLLDNSILRCARISPTPATAEDEIKAHNLMFGESLGPQEAATAVSDEDSRPAKRRRQEPALGAIGLSQGAPTATNIVPRVVAGFWRTRQKKMSHGPRGLRRLGESAAGPVVGEPHGSGHHPIPSPVRPVPGVEAGGSSRGIGSRTDGGTSHPARDTSEARGKTLLRLAGLPVISPPNRRKVFGTRRAIC